MQQMFSRNTKVALLSKDLRKNLNWISMKRSHLSSESTPYAHSSPSALQMTFASSKSTAKTPFCTAKATSRSTFNNLKDSLTPIILTPCFCSTKRYMASSKHHVYGTYFYPRLL